MKLDQLIDLIKKKNYFGRCIGRKLSICLNLDNLGILKIVSTLFSKQLCTWLSFKSVVYRIHICLFGSIQRMYLNESIKLINWSQLRYQTRSLIPLVMKLLKISWCMDHVVKNFWNQAVWSREDVFDISQRGKHNHHILFFYIYIFFSFYFIWIQKEWTTGVNCFCDLKLYHR